MATFVYGEDIDRHLNWSLGKAERLARRGKLPHYMLPDGSLRFCLEEINALVQRIDLPTPMEVVHDAQ